MGIPGYFSRYAIKFPNTIIKKKIELIDALFLDFNCAIHPCCRKFAKEQYTHNRKEICEKYMIDECLSHLIKLIKYSSPTRLVYLAIDGVAPRAKMVQQRNRRFKSIKEKQLDNEILKKCSNNNQTDKETDKENEESELWDTNSISPGTVFMAKLADALKKYFKESNEPYLEQLTIIISDSNEPGEGEHKILEYIKTHQHQITPKYNIAIYGLDADLIMLSMVSHINRIYLLRESVEFGAEYFNDGTTFCYLDIDLFKYSIMTELTEKIRKYAQEKAALFPDAIFPNLLLTPKQKPPTARQVYDTVKKYLSLVTTAEKKSPHVLRHSFATHLTGNGAELNAVKELLGHSSLAATQVYTHNNIERLRDIHKKAHPKG